ncbi:zinc ribbon domain-containing protein, partial [Kingella kingae]|uniref:zinc ribbon domain-containing protein n=1 Tax=Kingella kingae TaxID=504 RepID=UPI00254A312C
MFAVPSQNTSRCCPSCGHTTKDNRQTQANFECVECGYQNNADVVGAINVLKRGQAIQAAWKTKIRAGRVRSACEVNNAVRLSAARTHR